MADETEVRRRNVGNGNVSSPGGRQENMNLKTDINLQRIRDKASKLKNDMLNQLEGQLQEMLDEFVQEVERIEQPPNMNGSHYTPKTRKKGELPDKEFVSRRSVLTDLFEISHIQTIYHIFVAILIVFSLNTIVYDAIDKGRLVVEFDIIMWAFGKFPIVMSLWVCMTMTTVIIVYPLFHYFAYNRQRGKVGWQDYCWLALYTAYQLAFLILPLRVLVHNHLPPASSVIIACEQVRYLMKSHAFVRENIPRVLKFDAQKAADDEHPSTPCPDFSKYLYFLFAPTLVYRDSYPRSPNPVRWNYVVSNFGQVLACLFYTYYIFLRFCVPVFNNFNAEHVSPRKFVLIVFGSMMPGTLVLFIGFFAILHSWLNAFAEMLRFADRMFYKDWWNSSSFANYYRTWNVVVHDWLYSYVYKDIAKITGNGTNRPLAMSAVFLLSAVFHEYILALSLGFFYPVLFVMFAGAGFGFIFLPKKAHRSGNVFMWVALFSGNGLLMCLYSMEWYARLNCKSDLDGFMDFITPRSWSCDYIHKIDVSQM